VTRGVPPMNGFVADFATIFKDNWPLRLDEIREVMECYTPDQLPVLNGLAKHYAVSDVWFSSVPTQTNANRAYTLAGTSLGLCRNGLYDSSFLPRSYRADDRFAGATTIMNVLSTAGLDWRVYWESRFPPTTTSLGSNACYTRRIFPELENIASVGDHFRSMDALFTDLAGDPAALPPFVFLEPAWTLAHAYSDAIGTLGDDYHPPGDLTIGEMFVKKVYDALVANTALWQETLLVVTFDEHGGTYDHMPPPWSATPPWGQNPPYFPALPTAQQRLLEYGFQFNRYGVRVPAIFISPWIERGTVIRSNTAVPFDHTSLIRTILEWKNVGQPWNLGDRVDAAPTFETVISRDTARTDVNYGPRPAIGRGTALCYGDCFRLQNEAGDWITGAEEFQTYWYPKLGQDADSAVFRFVPSDWAPRGPIPLPTALEVKNGTKLQIQSLEDHLGDYSVLSAWRALSISSKYCFYNKFLEAPAAWYAFLWGYWSRDASLCIGDTITLINPWWYHQRLTGKADEYLTTEPLFSRWTIAPQRTLAPGRGAAFDYGDKFLLRNRSGEYVIAAEQIGTTFYPRLGTKPQAVELFLTGGAGAIPVGSAVKLCTTEPAVRTANVLGAWRSPTCYYWTDGDAREQKWVVTVPGYHQRDGAAVPVLKDGDRVYFGNVGWKNQRLARNLDDLNADHTTTRTGALDYWTIEKV
jgi:phospholipase C